MKGSQPASDLASYGAGTRALHWSSALCVVLAWLLGVLGDELPRGLRPGALFSHITLGLAVVLLALARLAWRLADRPPGALPAPAWMGWTAGAMHGLLYGLMIAVPLVGIVLQFARGQALPLFGLGEIASPWPRDRTLARSEKEVHELLAHLTLLLASLHAAAALIHHLVLRDSTLRRMLPSRRG